MMLVSNDTAINRKHQMYASLTIDDFECDGMTFSVEVEFKFTASKSFAGDWDSPPEGSEIDVKSATVVSVHGEDGEEVFGLLEEEVVSEFLRMQRKGVFDEQFERAALEGSRS